MISMLIVFYMFVTLFAVMGSLRGWARELLVIFGAIVAMAFIAVIEQTIDILSPFIISSPVIQFYVRIVVLFVIVFLGYQSPRFARLSKAVEKRDRIQDFLLGLLLGAVSGYMVVGTLWSYAHTSGYTTLTQYVQIPTAQVPGGEAAIRLIDNLPPILLGNPPNVYIAVVLAFIVVIAVFV